MSSMLRWACYCPNDYAQITLPAPVRVLGTVVPGLELLWFPPLDNTINRLISLQ